MNDEKRPRDPDAAILQWQLEQLDPTLMFQCEGHHRPACDEEATTAVVCRGCGNALLYGSVCLVAFVAWARDALTRTSLFSTPVIGCRLCGRLSHQIEKGFTFVLIGGQS